MQTYIILEAGQNHNGSMDIARQLINVAAMSIVDPLFDRPLPRANAIKFTKRDLSEELSQTALSMPYNSPHAFGSTYGEHRAFLELSEEQHHELFTYAKEKGLDFIETLCSLGTLNLLKHFLPDKLKVASRDLTNLPLLNAMAETHIPMIISTGMAGRKELDDAIDTITKHHSNISILHCLSQYPSDYPYINLRTLDFLHKTYPQFNIGYSDHSIGIMMPLAAVARGAQIIEKHITIDRSMKGSDHACSLEPEGVWRMIRDIRNLELAMGTEDIIVPDVVSNSRIKLERSIATKRSIRCGEIIQPEDIHLLSPGDGFRWSERHMVIGKMATIDIEANEVIYPHMLSQLPKPATNNYSFQ